MLGGVDVTGPHLYSIHPHGSTDKLPYVTMVSHYRYQGYISAALVLGGVDVTGPLLYSIHPHGSTDKLPYVTMDSHYRYQGYISAALVLGGVDVECCISAGRSRCNRTTFIQYTSPWFHR